MTKINKATERIAITDLKAGDVLVRQTLNGPEETAVKAVAFLGGNVVIVFAHGGRHSYPKHHTPTVEVVREVEAPEPAATCRICGEQTAKIAAGSGAHGETVHLSNASINCPIDARVPSHLEDL
jgi:hypothetical protein